MASIRLTSNLKKNIVDAVESSYTDMILKANKSLPEDFLLHCATYFLSTAIEPFMSGVPEKWQIEVGSVRVKIYSEDGLDCFINEEHILTAPIMVPNVRDLVSISYQSHVQLAVNVPTDFKFPSDFIEEANAYNSRLNAARTERDTAKAAAEVMTKNCNTVKQLLTVWPEGRHFVPTDLVKATEPPPRKKRQRIDSDELKKVAGTLNAGLLRKQILDNT